MKALVHPMLLAVVVGLVGCPKSGSLETTGDSVHSEPRPEDQARIRALESENRRLANLLRAASSGEDELPLEVPPEEPSLAKAQELHAAGDAVAALEMGTAVLDDLQDLGVEVPLLVLLLGEWALEVDQPDVARHFFGEAVLALEKMSTLIEEARARESIAAAAALGPDAAALAEAVLLREGGDPGAAFAALQVLAENGVDETVLARAAVVAAEIREQASELSVERLDRADALLSSDDGPWDGIGELLDSVESLPEGTFDPDEVRRLRAWYRSRVKETGTAEGAAEEERLRQLLAEARAHVAAERYREAVVAYRGLEGTALQKTARDESRAAIDTLVKAERERAGRLFTAARKKPDTGLKRAALEEVAGLLRGLLDEFPDSGYASRVRDNLAVVEKELAKSL